MENSVVVCGDSEALEIVFDVRKRQVVQLVDSHGYPVIASMATKLMCVDDLNTIISGLEGDSQQCGIKIGKKLATWIAGQYRPSDFVNLKAATSGMALVLSEQSTQVAKLAANTVFRNKYRPNAGDVLECVQAEISKRRAQVYAAKSQLKEHQRREASRREEKKHADSFDKDGRRIISRDMLAWRKSMNLEVDCFVVR